MENTIQVLYRILPENDGDNIPNAFLMKFPDHRKYILLADILLEMLNFYPHGINFQFYTRSSNGVYQYHFSPTSAIPLKDRKVKLYLKPAVSPPFTLLNEATILSQSFLELNREPKEQPLKKEPKQSVSKGADFQKRESRPVTFDGGENRSANNAPTTAEKFNIESLVSEETVAAISEVAGDAAAAAKEVAGVAARSFMNFAARSIKTVTAAAANLTGQVQVRTHTLYSFPNLISSSRLILRHIAYLSVLSFMAPGGQS